MRRLTLRAADDSRFLARIVHRDGFAFVLDYGDALLIADATERISRGFAVRDGKGLVQVAPNAPDILDRLAAFYEAQGFQVSIERPLVQLPEQVFPPEAATPTPPASAGPRRAALVPPRKVFAGGDGAEDVVSFDEPPELAPVDEEATELVPLEMRLKALGEHERTERHSVLGDLAAQALAELGEE